MAEEEEGFARRLDERVDVGLHPPQRLPQAPALDRGQGDPDRVRPRGCTRSHREHGPERARWGRLLRRRKAGGKPALDAHCLPRASVPSEAECEVTRPPLGCEAGKESLHQSV